MNFFGNKQSSHTISRSSLWRSGDCNAKDNSAESPLSIVAQGLSKKPVASVASSLYLRAATSNQYGKVEALPPTKQNWIEYERLRLLAWRLRRNAGISPWGPLAFALCVLLGFAVWAHRQSAKDFTYAAPEHKFQILKRFDAYHYQFRWINGGTSTDLGVVFCPDYEPQLSAGQTLTFLRYQDLGRCWDILPEGYGYSFETTDGVHPTLAPNCFVNDRDVTECKPNQMEAKFQ